MSTFNQSFENGTPQPPSAVGEATPQPQAQPQSQQQQQLEQLEQLAQSTQPVAQLPGQDFLAPLPIPNPPSATASTSNEPPKTLWMGDLDPWSDEEAIANLWEQLGKHVQVKLIKAKRGTPAANLNTGHAGYCFVEFDNYDEAKSALALNGSVIPNTNRVFRLNWASGATLSSPIPQSPEYSLFVGDLTPSTTEAHLLALFQAHFKSVKTVRVMTDPITGTSRCFGFVRFGDQQERQRALTEMSGVWCAGRPLRVALATPRNQAQNAHMGGVNPMGAQFGNQFAPAQFQPQQQQQPDMMMYPPYQQAVPSMPYFDQDQAGAGVPTGASPANMQSMPFTDPNNTTVFVGGLASGVTDSMLATLFQPFGPIVHIKIPPNKGCGFIRFENREDAVNAINAMQGFAVGGSRIRLSWGRQQNPQQRMQFAMAAGVPPPAGAPPMTGAPGLGPPAAAVPNGLPQGIPGGAFTGQMVAPVTNMYYMPTEADGFQPFEQFGQMQDPAAFQQNMGFQNSQMQQPPSQHSQQQQDGERNSSSPERNSEVPEGEDGSKLQEMYRAAVAGKLDSLN